MGVQLGSRNFDLPLEDSLLIRLDFTDDEAWRAVCQAVQKPTPDDGFVGFFDFVDERALDGTDVDELIALLPDETFYVADSRTTSDPELSILVVGYAAEDDSEEAALVPSSFRVIPSAAWMPENNLRIGNMDFEEFLDSVDEDGVLRGVD
ncbi:hypothetical protein H5P33_29890 [Mycolicibacterium arabiense]|nr:hypothetical protein [Mycolicibacterium arabiense]MCV7376928.1 hypothetical protein [Mycolicibacterium arabiense]